MTKPTTTTYREDDRRAALSLLRLHHDDPSYDFDAASLRVIEDSLNDLTRLLVEVEDLRRQVRGRGEAALTLNLALPDRGLCGNGRAAKAGRSALVAAARHAATLEGARALETDGRGVELVDGLRDIHALRHPRPV